MKNPTKSKTPNTSWVSKLPSNSVLLNTELEIIGGSEKWFNTFEFNREDTTGKKFLSLFPYFKDSWQDSFEYSLEGLTEIKNLDKFTDATGIKYDFVWNINPWRDGYGKVVGVIINAKEISEKTAIELELKQTQKLLKDKGEVAKIGSWEYNIAADQLYWSKELREILKVGTTIKPTLKKTSAFFDLNEDNKVFNILVKNAITFRKPWNRNFQLKTKKGDVIWVNTIGRPKFKGDKCVRIIGTIQNINDTYNPEIEKPVQKEIVTSWKAIEELPAAFVSIDLKTGKILRLNKAFSLLIGLSKETFLNKHFKNFVPMTILERVQWSRSIIANKVIDGLEKEVCIQGLNSQTSFKFNGKLIQTKDDKLELLINCQDISKYFVRERDLTSELKEANSELDKFVHFSHMVAHDLKAHATNIHLLLNFLIEEHDADERKKILKIIFDSTEDLTTTIKGLRELVTIRHEINEKKTLIPLNEVIFNILEKNKGLIKMKKAKIHNEIPENFEVLALPIYLESIVSSFLLNAIKFKNKKKPVIILKVEQTSRYNVLSIEDNSLGMDLSKPEEQPFQLYKSPINMEDSSGMGLYLAKYQIEIMKGEVYVESTPKNGNLFKVYFLKKSN